MVSNCTTKQDYKEEGWNEPWLRCAHGPAGGGDAPADTPLNWLLPTSPSAWDECILEEAVEVVKGCVMEDCHHSEVRADEFKTERATAEVETSLYSLS